MSPSIGEISNQGLLDMVDFLDKNIDSRWEIYSNPFLNGERPTCILLNPEIGIVVLEVVSHHEHEFLQEIINNEDNLKNRFIENGYLELNNYERYLSTIQELDDSKTFDFDQHIGSLVKLHSNNEITSSSLASIASILLSKQKFSESILTGTARKVRRQTHIKRAIHDIYCPRLGSSSNYSNIHSLVVFSNCSNIFIEHYLEKQLSSLLLKESNYHKFVTRDYFTMDSTNDRNFKTLFSSQDKMSEPLASDLRNWLVEPYFAEQERRPLTLDSKQRSLVENRTQSGYRRIKGAAGSGKSLVLASRAGKLWENDKKVLIVTFNITLMEYLRRLTQRYIRFNLNLNLSRPIEVTYLNFHYLCKRIAIILDRSEEYGALWSAIGNDKSKREEVLNERLAEFVNSLLDQKGVPEEFRFDAVLVDEGQDFLPSWWALLRRLLNDDGEMILVADKTQDLYERSNNWTDDSMTGAGFSGEWMTLDNSYRLPEAVRRFSESFASQYLPSEERTIGLPRENSLFDNCQLGWIQTSEEKIIKVSVDEAITVVSKSNDKLFSFTDVTILVFRQEDGERIQKILKEKNVNFTSTFADSRYDERSKKMAFTMQEAKVKITTIHSFKGWEARAVIIVMPECKTLRQMATLYTGITRVAAHPEGSYLLVISSSDEMIPFGETFPNGIIKV